MRSGIILLAPDCMDVLGGAVASLVQAWQEARSIQQRSSGTFLTSDTAMAESSSDDEGGHEGGDTDADEEAIHAAVLAAYGGGGSGAPPFTAFTDTNVAAARQYYQRRAAAASAEGLSAAAAAGGGSAAAASFGPQADLLTAQMRALVLTPEATAAEAEGGVGSWKHPVGAAAAAAAIQAELAAAQAANGGAGLALVLQRHQLGLCKGKPVYDAWAAVQLATSRSKSGSAFLGGGVVSLELLKGASGLLHVANALEGGADDPDGAQLAATVRDPRGGTRVAVFSPAMQQVLLGGMRDSTGTQARLAALRLQMLSAPPAVKAVVLRVKPGATPFPIISDLPADQSSAAAANAAFASRGGSATLDS